MKIYPCTAWKDWRNSLAPGPLALNLRHILVWNEGVFWPPAGEWAETQSEGLPDP